MLFWDGALVAPEQIDPAPVDAVPEPRPRQGFVHPPRRAAAGQRNREPAAHENRGLRQLDELLCRNPGQGTCIGRCPSLGVVWRERRVPASATKKTTEYSVGFGPDATVAPAGAMATDPRVSMPVTARRQRR